MAKITKRHRADDEPVNYDRADITCAYLDCGSGKTYIEFLIQGHRKLKVALDPHEMSRVIESQNDSVFEYRQVLR